MDEILKWLKEYWAVLIGIGGLVVYLVRLGLGLKSNEDDHSRYRMEFEAHKLEEATKMRDLENKYESLASAFHNTEVEQGKMLAGILTSLDFMKEQQTQLIAKLDKLIK